MAKTIIINGVIYNDVKQMTAPLASDPSQTAVFPETSDGDAMEDDIIKNKIAYAGGKRLVGTRTVPTFSLTSGVLTIS